MFFCNTELDTQERARGWLASRARLLLPRTLPCAWCCQMPSPRASSSLHNRLKKTPNPEGLPMQQYVLELKNKHTYICIKTIYIYIECVYTQLEDIYMYIFLRSTRHLSLALGLRGVRGPAWSRAVPTGRPEFLFWFPPRWPEPVLLCLCAPKPGRLCAGQQLSVPTERAGWGKGEENACFPCHLLQCRAALWQL